MSNNLRIFLMTFFMLFFLSACFGSKTVIKDDAVFKKTIPVCDNEATCKKMWDAAWEWVDKHSPQGIETYNDMLIRSEEKDLGSYEMEIEVRKVKQADGSFKIVIDNICPRGGSACAAERRNMIAFNKKLGSFMSKNAKATTQKVFEGSSLVQQWFDRYNQLVIANNANALATMFHFPVTYIEKDDIRVISNKQDLDKFLTHMTEQFKKLEGVYLKTAWVDVFRHSERNIYVSSMIHLYDVDNTKVAAQQINFHLVTVDGKWLLVSAATHTE